MSNSTFLPHIVVGANTKHVSRGGGFRLTLLSLLLVVFNWSAYAQNRPAIYYVGDAGAMNGSDQAVADRLKDLGFSVTVKSGADSDPSDAAGQQLIVISSTLGSGTIADKFTTTAVPVINWEASLADEFGYNANNANGTTFAGSQINIVNPSHPLAAGLPAGPRLVVTQTSTFSTPDLPLTAGAIVVATEFGGNRPVLVGIEKGAALNPVRVATAPARRVCFYFQDDTARFSTDDGWTLFDTAVAWAAGPADAPVAIAKQPSTVTAVENQSASLSVVITGAPVWKFQWQKSTGGGAFSDIAGATSRTLSLTSLKIADSGASYRVQVSNAFGNVTSGAATVTVTPDKAAPTLVRAETRGNPSGVFVVFNEAISATTANNKANYTIDNGITVNSAALQSDNVTVALSTSAITPGKAYKLTVSGVQDTAAAPNTVQANSTVQFVQTDGVIERRVFNNIGGNSVDNLTSDAKFLADKPDEVTYPTSFQGPTDFRDTYGTQFRGYVTAPLTGNYVFFISTDDNGALFLSTDENPANKSQIAAETNWSNTRQWVTSGGTSDLSQKRSDQAFGTITLTAGKRYYIEALQKEGSGGDNIAVTWQLPGAAEPVNGDPPIPGAYLSAFGVTAKPISITTQPASQTVIEPARVTFSVVATGFPPASSYQWLRNGSAITGATSSSYTIPLTSRADTGAKFSVQVANGFSSVTSSEATLTVTPDTTAPRPFVVGGTILSSKTITLSFDELVDKSSAETAVNYVFAPGNIAGTTAVLDANGTNVTITAASALTASVTNTLTISGVKDIAGNTTVSGTSIKFIFKPVTYADNILFDGPLGYYRFEETSGSVAKNSGTKGGDGAYYTGDESAPGAGGSPSSPKGEAGPRPPAFVGFDAGNRSATFDGAGEWVDTKNQFLQGLGAFSLEYWVKTTDRVNQGNRIGIVGQNDAIEYGYINPTTIQIWTPNGGSLNTTVSFPDNEWHHIATIASGSNLRTYYDGVLAGSGGGATSNYGTSIYNVHIGGAGVFDVTGNYFNGNIDEVAIFDKAIPAERIAAHFKAGKEGGVLVTSLDVTVPSGGAAPKLSASRSGNNVSISWAPAGGTLQSASDVTGPWADVGAANPTSVTIGTGNRFYRVKP